MDEQSESTVRPRIPHRFIYIFRSAPLPFSCKSVQPTENPLSTQRRRILLASLAVLVLLFTLAAQVIHAVRGQSLTWDEGDHIFAGYKIWDTHDYGLNPEHPPMVKMLGALPLLPLHLSVPPLQGRFFKSEAYLDGQQLLYRNAPRYTATQLILRARLPELLFSLSAALLVFAAACEMFSLQAGLFALLLFCFEPNLLAHSAYVTTDMAASCTIFATIYALWRWTQRPTSARLLVVGLAAGLALAAKHSTVLLAPMLLALLATELVRAWRLSRTLAPGSPRAARSEAAARTLLAVVVITLVACAVLWAFYGFRYTARPTGLALAPTLQQYVAPLATREASGILWLAHYHLLPESWLYGLADVRSMANGMPSYFFGHVYAHGVWFYFPVLFTIKATLAMLALLLLTFISSINGWLPNRRALWFLALPPALYMLVAMDSHLNIGVRHILPVFVFCCVLTGATCAALVRRGRVWATVIVVLLALHIGSTLHAAPNYMAYANEAWGGPARTYQYLTDSNTDWGQQLVATSTYLRQHHIQHCWFAYFVAPFVDPADYGIPCKPLPTLDTTGSNIAYDVPPVIDGPVLISAGDLNGFEFGSSVLNPYESFRSLQPSAYIQDGVFVFNGSFAVPLASALGHSTKSSLLLKAGNIPDALHEAQLAEQLAPGEVTPELTLGDALTAAHRATEAREAYRRARHRISSMDPDAAKLWLARIPASNP